MLTQSLRLFPPESYPAFVLMYSSNYIVDIKNSTDSSKSLPLKPFILPNKYKCSTGVRFSQIQSNYGHIPTFLNISGSFLLNSLFIIFILPELFGIYVVNVLNIVDFPAPLGPSKPRISD